MPTAKRGARRGETSSSAFLTTDFVNESNVEKGLFC